MEIPKKLKIGGHVYEVQFEKEGNFFTADKCAMLNRNKGIIHINDDLVQSEKEAALFHEVIHALGVVSEETTEYFAQGIYAFLKDNKLLK